MKKLFLLIPALVLAIVTNAQTDFSSPYNCTADAGVISGDAPAEKVYLNESADPHQIEWSDVSQTYTAVISWTVNATQPCYIAASLDLGTAVSSNKHIFEVKVLDADGNEMGAVEEGPAYTGDGFTEANQVKALSGKILLPAAGNYTIELRNNRNFCKGSIKNIILSYAGVAPVTDFSTPYSCTADDATLVGEISSSFSLYDASEPHYIKWSDRALADPASATWQIIVTAPCYVSASLDLGPVVGSNKHIYEVRIFDANNAEVGMVNEAGESTDANQVKALDGKILIPAAGNYTIELKNNRDWGKGSVKNVILSYAGAAPYTDFSTPYTCAADDATLVGTTGSSFGLNTEADPHYIFWSDRALANPSSTTWQIQATRACNISVSLDLGPVISSNKHIYEVRIFDANNVEVGMVGESAESIDADQIKVLAGSIQIPAVGNYTIELKNNRDWGKGSVKNVILSYAGGAVVNIPNAAIPFADAILSENATRNLESNPQEIHFGSPNASQYAKWNIHAVAGLYTFTFDVVGTNYGTYKLDILEGNDNIFTYTQGKQASGQVTISKVFIPAEGDYVLQLANTNSGADGYLTSLAATAATDVFVLDESTEDDGSIAAAAETGEQYTFLLKRSFTAGKYYTICLPVGSWNSELKLAFGDDYELWQMSSATQTGDEIDLNFEQTTSFSAGKPYIIKPSVDVKNPIFYNKKEIKNYTYNNVQEFTAADFVGTFYKDVIPAGESNLYLQNNNLYYSETNNTQIKGTRAWIRLKSQSGAAPKARIVLRDNTATAIDLVNSENKAIKRIENGQVVIIRDGQKYNVMGIKLQ